MFNVIASFFIFFKMASTHQPLAPGSAADLHLASDQILGVVDDVFITLRISDNFKRYKSVPEYLSIHNYIRDAVENRNEKYKELYSLSKVTPSDKADYYVAVINKVIGEMISEHRATTDLYFTKELTETVPNPSDDVMTDFVNMAKQLRLNLNLTYSIIPVKDTQIAKNHETRRIFAGVETEIRDWPFIVSIHIAGKFACAGSIIREDMVLSAATCFMKFYSKTVKKEFKNNIWIRAGSHFYNSGGVTVQSRALHFHPHFDAEERVNNIVVMQLKVGLVMKRRLIQPIRCARRKARYNRVDILGWGNKNYESRSATDSPEFVRMTELPEYSDSNNTQEQDKPHRRKFGEDDESLPYPDRRLLHSVLEGYTLLDCRGVYPNYTITNKNFCAGSSKTGSGACKFDLGGPGVVGTRLEGIVSFGPSRCGIVDAPTVFTKVYRYANWLDKLFCKHPMSNDTVDDSGQRGLLEEIGPDGKRVRYADESYILNEIKKDLRAGYRNPAEYLDLPIGEDYARITFIESSQETHPSNNIYLDPNLVNSSEVFQKLKQDESASFIADHEDEIDQVYNWALYKEFMEQVFNNNSNEATTEATETSGPGQSTVAETVSLLSEMQEEYDERNKEEHVEFEYEDAPSLPNDKMQKENVEFNYEDVSDVPKNDENKAHSPNYTPDVSDSDTDSDKAHTQNIEFVYEDTLNNEDPVNTKRDANDIAEIIISDSGTTQTLLLNKKDLGAVNRFVDELSRLKDRVARTSTMRIFYREEESKE